MKRRPPPERCPVCDAQVPRNAAACPDCGSCYESGWRTEDEEDDTEEEFDYDRWLAREEGREQAPEQLNPLWKWAALAVLLALGTLILLRVW